jgi:hypothetical protein
MPKPGEMTEKQKQRAIQAKADLELEKNIVDWIEKVIHQRPPVEDEESYTKYIRRATNYKSLKFLISKKREF